MTNDEKKLKNEELMGVTGGEVDQVGIGNEAPEGKFDKNNPE